MTAPNGRTAALTQGLRGLLLATGVPAVTMGLLKDEVDGTVALVPYPIDDDMQTGTVLQAVQVWIRGTPTGGTKPVLDRQDQIFDTLGTLRGATVGGIHVLVCWRQISAPLSLDGRGRPEVRDTYYLRTDRLGFAG